MVPMANSLAAAVVALGPTDAEVDEPECVMVTSTVGVAPSPVTSVSVNAVAMEPEKFTEAEVMAAAFLHHHISRYCGVASWDAPVILTQVLPAVSVGALVVMLVDRAEMHMLSVLPSRVGDVLGVMPKMVPLALSL